MCFVGMDGSGKTTQAKALADAMRRAGIRTKYVQNRFEPRITNPFICLTKALFFRGKDSFQNYAEYSYTKKRLFRNPLISTAYTSFSLIDYFFQNLIRNRIPLMCRNSIVCDRYVHDTVVDLAVDHDYSHRKRKTMLKKFLFLAPKPDMMFLIDLPEEIACQRKADIPSIDYLKERRKIYLDMAKEYGMVILDGTKDATCLENSIEDSIKSLIGDFKACGKGWGKLKASLPKRGISVSE